MDFGSLSARTLTYGCAGAAFALGAVVLLGWDGDLGVLHRALARGPGTRPVTGACLVALSCALVAGRLTKTWHLGPLGRWAWGLACLATLGLAGVLLLQLFVLERGTSRPASPHTVTSMVLIALAIAASFRPAPRWRQSSVVLALAGAAIPWIALLGYATSAPFFYSMPDAPDVGMSVVTAPALLLIATGVLGLWPDHGFVALLLSRTTGGLLMRTLLPAGLIVPVLSGAILNYGESAGWFSRSVALGVTLGLTTVVFVGLVLGIGLLLKRQEAVAEQAAAEREMLLAQLQASVAELRELQSGFVTMCAWTRRVLDHGEWVQFEEFLEKRLRIGVTHSISAEAADDLIDSLEKGERNPVTDDDFFDVPRR